MNTQNNNPFATEAIADAQTKTMNNFMEKRVAENYLKHH